MAVEPTTLPVPRADDEHPGEEHIEALGAVRRLRAWVVLASLALLAAALCVTAATIDADSGQDVGGIFGTVGHDLARLRWQFAAIAVALGAVHYLATAVAARAAAGLPLPMRETLLVQLAAAAANRLTPAGLGGSALNARYFSRRGLTASTSVVAVAALAILGAAADLVVLCLLVLGVQAFGLGGGTRELTALLAHIRHLLGPARSPWLWLVVAVGLGAAGAWWVRRSSGWAGLRNRVWPPVRHLATRPRDLVTLLVASGATTLVLGIAFLASIAMVPGPQPTASAPVIIVAFMLGAAAGSSVPVPAGLGSTEAALVAVLVGVGETAARAVQVVMVFRIITFWAPAGVGVFAGRYLYRRAAI